MKKVVGRSLAGIIASAFLIYVSDYAVFRYRVATSRSAYGSTTVQFYYAIQQKNGKTEYDFQPPRQETCVNSLFAHSGYPPCWYERKHAEKAIHV